MEKIKKHYNTFEKELWKRAIQCAIEYDKSRRQAMIAAGLMKTPSAKDLVITDETLYHMDMLKIAEVLMSVDENSNKEKEKYQQFTEKEMKDIINDQVDKWNLLNNKAIENEINYKTLRKQMRIEAGLEYQPSS